MSELDDDKTPILLHPARRIELLHRGRDLFNEEHFFEAHEVWEELWHVESGRDRVFVQGLIQMAAHLVHLRKGNWSGALSVSAAAREKLSIAAAHRLYRELDIAPLFAALDYNRNLLEDWDENGPPPVPDAFLIPKLF
jgi:predicted metal-dependent hydrolase